MTLTVFDEDITLSTTPHITHHNRRFLNVIRVEELGHVFFRKATLAEVRRVASALSSHIEPEQSLIDPIWLLVFNNGLSAIKSISMDTTHAFSVFSEVADGMRHQCFERRDDAFREVPSLSTVITKLPDIDDIRMLHFAKFPLGQLPARSAIFEFKAEVWKIEATLGQGYSTLRVGILEDTQRIAGAPTIGLYGDEFYAALMAGNGDGGNCGNAETCPPGGQGSCEPVPPRAC
jgi:hypothetical protein